MEDVSEVDLFMLEHADDHERPAKRARTQDVLQLQRAFLSDDFFTMTAGAPLTTSVPTPKNQGPPKQQVARLFGLDDDAASLSPSKQPSMEMQDTLRYHPAPTNGVHASRTRGAPRDLMHEDRNGVSRSGKFSAEAAWLDDLGGNENRPDTEPPPHPSSGAGPPLPHVRRLFSPEPPSPAPIPDAIPTKPPKPSSATPSAPHGPVRVFRRPPQHARSLPVTSAGRALYLSFKPSQWKARLHTDLAAATSAVFTSAPGYRRFRTLLETVRTEMEAAAPARTLPEVVLPPLPVEGARRMWVEQFRASRYLDLLSDETVNRALLQWLKLWDGCVFHREPKLHTHLGFGKRKAANNPKTFVPRAFGGVPDYCFTLDADRRPRFKTALLCGPPGLGKTTLAHVIARHAGYDTLEINASDDRALDVFRNRVESSLMHGNIAALMQDGVAVDRPKCLIIDEVDGAPAATVDYLVHLLKGEAKSASGKKKAQRKLALWRPIICICNDQYVPALKPLRQVSVVVQFPPIHRERLAQRMLDICRSLPIQADSSVIHVLCEKSEDDIRTCLNTIQFASVQGNRLAVADISQTTIGRKDSRKQLFGIWDTVFRAPGAGRQNEISEGASEKDSTRSVLRTVQQEDLEKILSGLYENYLRVKHKESRLISAAQCANWFCFADILERGVMEEQSWFLRGYASFSPVALHVLLSGNAVPKLNFPQQQVEFRSRCGRNKEIMDAFVKDLPAGLYRVVKSGALSSEFVPYLVNILQPILKGHNIQLLNPSERVLVRDVVAQMVAYGVSYREESSPSGTVDLLLDPHLEAVAHFPGTSPTSAAGTLTLAAKEMIAAQVRLRLVEVEASHAAPPETPTPGVMETPEVLLGLGSVPEKEAGHRGVSSRKLRVWSVQEYLRQQVPMDPDAPVVVAGGTKRRVWYKYKEGCTNAVCRDVQVQRFL